MLSRNNKGGHPVRQDVLLYYFEPMIPPQHLGESELGLLRRILQYVQEMIPDHLHGRNEQCLLRGVDIA